MESQQSKYYIGENKFNLLFKQLLIEEKIKKLNIEYSVTKDEMIKNIIIKLNDDHSTITHKINIYEQSKVIIKSEQDVYNEDFSRLKQIFKPIDIKQQSLKRSNLKSRTWEEMYFKYY